MDALQAGEIPLYNCSMPVCETVRCSAAKEALDSWYAASL